MDLESGRWPSLSTGSSSDESDAETDDDPNSLPLGSRRTTIARVARPMRPRRSQAGRRRGFDAQEMGNQPRLLLMRLVLLLWVLLLLMQGDTEAGHDGFEPASSSTMSENGSADHLQSGRLRGTNLQSLQEVDPAEAEFEKELEMRRKELQLVLNRTKREESSEYADNVTVVFRGVWKKVQKNYDQTQTEFPQLRVHAAVEVNSNFTPAEDSFQLGQEGGATQLELWSIKTRIEGMHYVYGRFDMLDGRKHTPNDVYSLVSGFYFPRSGTLKLFLTSAQFKSPHVGIDYLRPSNPQPDLEGNASEEAVTEEELHEDSDEKVELKVETEGGESGISKNLSFLEWLDLPPLEEMEEGKSDVASPWARLWEEELGVKTSQVRKRFLTRNAYHRWKPNCFFRFDLQLAPRQKSPLNSLGFREMNLKGTSDALNCPDVRISYELSALDVDSGDTVEKASLYSDVECINTLIQFMVLVVQHNYSRTPTATAKVSLVMVAFLAVIDAGFAFAYMSSGLLLEKLFGAFVITAFIKLLVFSVFEMRYLLVIWKARHPQNVDDSWATTQELQSKLYSRIYIVLFACICVMWLLSSFHRSLWFISMSFWVPQIVCNVFRDTGDPLNSIFLLWTSISRLLPPLYFYGCPKNFVTLLFADGYTFYDPGFCALLAIWVFFQVSVLMVQKRIGPQSFVPARFLPPKYDYNRRIPDELRDTQCAICLHTVTGVDEEHMITPCSHLFHRDCLRVWIAQKMECPTCRAQLPPI